MPFSIRFNALDFRLLEKEKFLPLENGDNKRMGGPK
jgi:hypothetical protein